jgi:periplasmic divalent cation tolerance protein
MSGENNYCIVYVTAPNDTIARKLAHGLVAGKLVACVNLVPQINSIYSWEGKIEESNEVLMMVNMLFCMI